VVGVDTAADPAPAGEPTPLPSRQPGDGPGRRPSILGVGVVVWLSSELMFFAGLFGTYFTLRAGTATWPPPEVHLDVPRTAAATAVLVASSATMHLAVLAAERGDRRGLARGLVATAALGGLFLANLVLEYRELEFTISDHAYGSIFYLMTGFHGLHVLGGIAFMVGALGLVTGRTQAPPGPPVAVCGYYWHFVDAVWIAMFATLYLVR